MKNCLDCKYEPEWGETKALSSNYPRRYGRCKWAGEIPVLPAVYSLAPARKVIRYSDDSGIETHCKAWEAKCSSTS